MAFARNRFYLEGRRILKSVSALRAFVLLVAVLLGQAHACRAYYALPSGLECATCPTEVCDINFPSHSETGDTIVSAEPDCHLCCTLQSCDDEGGKTAQNFSPISADLVLPEELEIVTLTRDEVLPSISVHVASQYANAPPSLNDSRAPPFHLI